jgi:hypothetical protein
LQDLATEMSETDELAADFTLTKEMGKNIKKLWKDSAIKSAFERQSEFQLNDSAA